MPSPPRPPEPSTSSAGGEAGARAAVALAAGSGVVAALAYVVTLYPSVAGGDSGELVAAACAMGVAHPPGYPLHTLLGHLASLLPFGTPAYRLNLFNALCSAGAASLLTWTVARWTKRGWAGLFSGALFAFSPLVWRYSLQAEVFALNHLVAAGLLALAVTLDDRPRPGPAYAAALLFGLGLANHHTIVFVGLPLLFWALWRARTELLRPKRVAALAGCCSLGLLPYLQLFLSAQEPSLASWGDTSHWNGFLAHLLRREYGTFQLGLHSAKPDLPRALGLYLGAVSRESLWLGLASAVWGLWRGGTLARVLGVAWALHLFVFHSLANLPLDNPLFLEVQARFWQLPNLVLFVLAGVGLSRIPEGRPTRLPRGAIPAAVAALVLVQLGRGYRSENQRGNRLFERFARAVLEPLPPSALLVTRGDLFLNTLRYLQHCEGVRTDVALLDRELLKSSWFARAVRQRLPQVRLPGELLAPVSAKVQEGYTFESLVAANPSLPVFVTTFSDDEDPSFRARYDTQPFGFVHRLVAKGTLLQPELFLRSAEPIFARFTPEELTRFPPGSWETAVADAYLSSAARRAGTVLAYALSHGNDLRWMQEARLLLEPLANIPEPPNRARGAVLKDLGVTYFHLRQREPALTSRMVEVWSRYLATRPPPSAEVEQIRRILASSPPGPGAM